MCGKKLADFVAQNLGNVWPASLPTNPFKIFESRNISLEVSDQQQISQSTDLRTSYL